MEPKSIAWAKPYVGKQEMFGSNEGPVIGVMKAFLGINARGISWCGIFVGWILCLCVKCKTVALDGLHFGLYVCV